MVICQLIQKLMNRILKNTIAKLGGKGALRHVVYEYNDPSSSTPGVLAL